MAMTTSSANAAFLRSEVGKMFVRALDNTSIALQVSTRIMTKGNSWRIPIVSADPTAGWVAEGAEITPSDATLTEAVVTPKKIAGLTIVSNELVADTSPTAAEVVGNGLARDVATRLDAAYFANTTTNGPSGIKSITTTVVSAGGSWTDVDPFTEAVYAVEGVGAGVNAWVANPADALLLASLKEGTDSNKGLLQPDATQPARRAIGGVPLYTSTAVTSGEVWGVPKDRVFVVVREDASIDVDRSVFFTSDRTAIKVTMRVGFAFPHPLAVVKVTKA